MSARRTSKLAVQKVGSRRSKPARSGGGQAGGGEQVVVVGSEGVGVLLVAGVKAQAEEQAEHVGEVVKAAGTVIVVGLDGPHKRMALGRVDSVAVGLGLGVEHEGVELVDRSLPLGPLVENGLFEEEAAVDVHDHLGRAR